MTQALELQKNIEFLQPDDALLLYLLHDVHLQISLRSSLLEYFIAPSLPIRVDQAVMPTPRGCRPPPTQGGGFWYTAP